MRLDRFVAHQTGCSRKDAVFLVRRGRVGCDGVVVRDPGARIDPATSVVELDGARIARTGHLHLLLHKPLGVVCARTDPRDRTVLDLVPEALRRRELSPIGRLDKDSTGLLLLTTDGALNHALTHPARHVDKEYRVEWTGALDPDAAERFSRGLELRDGTHCKPALLTVLEAGPEDAGGSGRGTVVLHEGRYHQVRRMIAACGARVVSLHRAAVGPLRLPADLLPGACRPLEAAELAALGAAALHRPWGGGPRLDLPSAAAERERSGPGDR